MFKPDQPKAPLNKGAYDCSGWYILRFPAGRRPDSHRGANVLLDWRLRAQAGAQPGHAGGSAAEDRSELPAEHDCQPFPH
nr:hypothetical protein [Anaerolineae bacterium]